MTQLSLSLTNSFLDFILMKSCFRVWLKISNDKNETRFCNALFRELFLFWSHFFNSGFCFGVIPFDEFFLSKGDIFYLRINWKIQWENAFLSTCSRNELILFYFLYDFSLFKSLWKYSCFPCISIFLNSDFFEKNIVSSCFVTYLKLLLEEFLLFPTHWFIRKLIGNFFDIWCLVLICGSSLESSKSLPLLLKYNAWQI